MQRRHWQRPLRLLQTPDPGIHPARVHPQWLPLHGEMAGPQPSSPMFEPHQEKEAARDWDQGPNRCAPFGLQVHHSDWFCGKAVGLLVLHLSGLVLNAYVTHVSEGWHSRKKVGSRKKERKQFQAVWRGWMIGSLEVSWQGLYILRYQTPCQIKIKSDQICQKIKWQTKIDGTPLAPLASCTLLSPLSQLHAEYNRQKDIYLAHRVAQAWELAQFIQCVSLGSLRGSWGGGPTYWGAG